ncbi:hypothetical protein MX569_04230 [Anoxybacillus kestanbolensis]|uniref:hypothetical protein n=1 Tax=Anoxybacillus kestanbolensis TaxID=227476 RepID=UPI00208DBEC1|nr:hypothetical protein [Anoxybacillus kestanbolensis]MCL9969800.1 hypothetical protein [Anoxybacillus kestanbolensis]
MGSIQEQLLLAEVKVKLMELMVNLQDDANFTKQDAIENIAEILDHMNQTTISFRELMQKAVKQ